MEDASVIGLKPHQVVRRGMGRTFQGTRLFRDMSVAENVLVGMDSELRNGLFASLLHVPSQLREERHAREAARFWLDFVGLGGQADRFAGELSYGDQRRLDIARALAGNPRVLLLDEPAAGMSTAERARLVRLLRTLPPRITLLFVEHDLDVVFALATSVTVLHLGRVLLTGAPDEVRASAAVQQAYLGTGREDLFLDAPSAGAPGTALPPTRTETR